MGQAKPQQDLLLTHAARPFRDTEFLSMGIGKG
jgi:hypothetical protein